MLYPSRKKYTSLIVSSVVHALLLLVLLYTRLYNQQDDFHLVPSQHHPAKVTMNMPGSQPQPSQAQKQPTTTTQKQQLLAHASSQSDNTNPQAPENPTLSQEVTPAQFMQTFKAAIATQKGASAQREGSEESQIPLHVQKRLKQWGQLSYRQRVAEAFLKAGALLSRTINTSQSIKKTIYLTIPILKNGALGDMSHNRLSMIPEVDRYIIDVLTSADFPPIPDRFNTDTFLLTVPMNISLKSGTGSYHLSVS